MRGDGIGIPITHTGSITLISSSHYFHLNGVLCAPTSHRNLISVSKFCISNQVSLEFFPTYFLVNDLKTRSPLA